MNAFEKPVWVGHAGVSLSERSRLELVRYEQDLAGMYGENGLKYGGDVYLGMEGKQTLESLLDQACEALR